MIFHFDSSCDIFWGGGTFMKVFPEKYVSGTSAIVTFLGWWVHVTISKVGKGWPLTGKCPNGQRLESSGSFLFGGGGSREMMDIWMGFTPQKSNIPTIAMFKGSYLFQPIILGIHVSFRVCTRGFPGKNRRCPSDIHLQKNICWSRSPRDEWQRLRQ